jgi:hypothetical protein
LVCHTLEKGVGLASAQAHDNKKDAKHQQARFIALSLAPRERWLISV